MQLPIKMLLACFIGLIASLVLAPQLAAQGPERTVLAHYMPWYASKSVSGQWGWHWTMNQFNPEKRKPSGQREAASHDYPLMDLYDSSDPELLECQVLLMKIAGIDGVVIDWYGLKDFRDYAQIHRNSQRLVRQIKRAGLRFAICYEDQTVKHMLEAKVFGEKDTVGQGAVVMQWLSKNWFSDDAYVKHNGRPVLLVFGPQYFDKQQWRQILASTSPRPLLYALPHLSQQVNADGAFGWPPVTGGREIEPKVWRDYLKSLYARPDAKRSVISVAFPGFQDIYQQAKLHDSYGSIDPREGRTFAETLELALNSDSSIVQLATWNDYGEGTVIEPTKANGYRYLEVVQAKLQPGVAYDPMDLRLPIMLYRLKKRHTNDVERMAVLKRASDLLFVGNCGQARVLLKNVSGE